MAHLPLSILLLLLAFWVSGCAHYRVNAPLAKVDRSTGYRFANTSSPTNSSELLLILAFSGGGTRAAALAYGVLEELARTQVGPQGKEHRLLDEVDIISSVSGGSFAAACYVLWGDRIFSDFEPQFLKKRVQCNLLTRCSAPWSTVRMASLKFNRTDLAAEYYDRLLFKGATFGDLAVQTGRPFLVVNATDIAVSGRFEFTQDYFDLLRSDVSQFPISRAVAASSAVPVLFGPIILKNYSAGTEEPEPKEIRVALTDPSSSSRLRNLARQARSYVDGRRRFVHLLDGGIADNLGLRSAVDRAIVHEAPTKIAPSTALQDAKRIAVIIVDAHTDPYQGWNVTDRIPGLGAVLNTVSSATISRYSFETVELFRETLGRLTHERPSGELSAYIVELHFNQLTDAADRSFYNSVPTSFQLPSGTVDRLRHLARRELASNKEYRELISDLGGYPMAQKQHIAEHGADTPEIGGNSVTGSVKTK